MTNANWAKVLGVPEEKIETIFPDGILHSSLVQGLRDGTRQPLDELRD